MNAAFSALYSETRTRIVRSTSGHDRVQARATDATTAATNNATTVATASVTNDGGCLDRFGPHLT